MSDSSNQELSLWVKQYTKEMLTWAVRRTSDADVAEDLVQDTFLVAAEKLASFRHDSDPRTWLFGILNNKIAEYYRSRSRKPSTSLDVLDPVNSNFSEEGNWTEGALPTPWHSADSHLLDDESFVRIFEECLAQLPVDWHACLTAKFIQSRSAEDICQELGLSTTNYWQIIHRAKLKMRGCLQQHWFSKEE